MPEAVTFTQARRNLATLLDRVVDDHNPLIITRHMAKPVVVMSLEDYNVVLRNVSGVFSRCAATDSGTSGWTK